jgi:hypothetical protein
VHDKETAKTLHYQTFGALCVTLRLLERIPMDRFNYLIEYGAERAIDGSDATIWIPHFQDRLSDVTMNVMVSDAIPASQIMEKTMYASLSFFDKVNLLHYFLNF